MHPPPNLSFSSSASFLELWKLKYINLQFLLWFFLLQIKYRRLDGIDLPYYEVLMKDGTPCDLTHQPRQTRVLYVCQPDGHGEVYQLKETSTCEYEVMVLTSVLCSHPLFRSGGSVCVCVSVLMCVCMTIIYVCECVYAVIICALSSVLFRQL